MMLFYLYQFFFFLLDHLHFFLHFSSRLWRTFLKNTLYQMIVNFVKRSNLYWSHKNYHSANNTRIAQWSRTLLKIIQKYFIVPWAWERVNQRSEAREQSDQCRARERVSGASEQVTGWASGPVLMSRFRWVLDHCAVCTVHRRFVASLRPFSAVMSLMLLPPVTDVRAARWLTGDVCVTS